MPDTNGPQPLADPKGESRFWVCDACGEYIKGGSFLFKGEILHLDCVEKGDTT